MEIPDDLAGRLKVALKVINLSPAALGAAVGVDKSVVSRWLAGKVVPNGHNLSRIGAEIARHRPGFSTLMFEASANDYRSALGVAPASAGLGQIDGLPLPYGAIDVARRETARRGDEYYGHYSLYYWSFGRSGRVAQMALMLRPSMGLIEARYGAIGFEFAGWALMMLNQLYIQFSEKRYEAMAFLLTNPGQQPRTRQMTGLLMGPGARFMMPTVSPIVLIREGDLTGDDATDEAVFSKRQQIDPLGDTVPPEVRSALLRQVDVTHAEGGTVAVLQALNLSAEG